MSEVYLTPPQIPSKVTSRNGTPGFGTDFSKTDHQHQLDSKIATGMIAYTIATASAYTNATATGTDITASTGPAPALTLALDPNRLYRVNFKTQFSITAGLNRAVFDLVVNGSVVATWTSGTFVGTAIGIDISCIHLLIPTTNASVVYKMQARSPDGGGAATLTLAGVTATHPIQFWIEDLGTLG